MAVHTVIYRERKAATEDMVSEGGWKGGGEGDDGGGQWRQEIAVMLGAGSR